MGDKVSYVGQGLVSGALEQGLELGSSPYTFVFVMYAFREQISVSAVSL